MAKGRAVGKCIGSGKVNILTKIDQMRELNQGEVLVADMLGPTWDPIMEKAGCSVITKASQAVV